MRLGLDVGYWGLGLSQDEQLGLVREAESRSGSHSVWAAEAYGPTPRRCSAGSRRRPSGSRSLGDFQMPGRSPAMTAMTAATLDNLSDGRMLLGYRLLGPAGGRGLARTAVRQADPAHARVRCDRTQGADPRAARVRGRDVHAAPPHGPGKALKLTIAPIQEQIPIYLAAIGPNNTRPERVRSPTAGCRSCSRPSTSEEAARAARRGRGARRPDPGRIVRRRAQRQRSSTRTSIARATRCGRSSALYVGRDGLARAQLLQRARPPLRVRGGGGGGAEPVPRRERREEAAAALPAELIDTVAICGRKERVAGAARRSTATPVSAR